MSTHLCLRHHGDGSNYADHNCVICVQAAEIKRLQKAAPDLPQVFRALESYGYTIPDNWSRPTHTSAYFEECWKLAE